MTHAYFKKDDEAIAIRTAQFIALLIRLYMLAGPNRPQFDHMLVCGIEMRD